MAGGEDLLVVEDLVKHFPVTRGIVFQKQVASVKAVDGISFTVKQGETLGVVGESGCGKSTMARCLMRLLDPTSGRITFAGRDITHLNRTEMRPIRRELMMIFQDPYASLNQRKRVGFIVAEALQVHKIGTPAEIKRRVQELLDVVGLNPEHYNRFPHEFSGGQRQRIGVARALAVNPKLIVCDEPVSALDVSVQAQILNLLKDLQRDSRADVRLHRARPQCRPPHLRPRARDVPGQGRRDRRPDSALRARRSIPTRARCSRPCRFRTPSSAACGARSCSRATCPTRSIRPRRAASTRAARASGPGRCDVDEPELRSFGAAAARGVPLPARALAAVRRRDPPGGRGSGGDGDRAMLAAAARRFLTLLAAIVGRDGAALAATRAAPGRLAEPLASPSVSTSSAPRCCSAASSSATGAIFRVANEEGMVGLRVPRGVRVASGDEQEESFNMTGLLVVAGILLLALGAAVDSNARLL